MSLSCPMGGRSKGKTCNSTAIGLGGTASRSLKCAMRGFGPPVLWRGDAHRGRCGWGRSILCDVSRHGHQRATPHTGMEAAPLDRVLFSDLEALAGDGSLSGAERRGILRPLGTAPYGLFGVGLHLTGHLPRSTHDGRDYL